MSKKRGNSEGSVYRRADGKWAGAVTLGFSEQGNPRRKVVYGGTRAEAARKLAELMDKCHEGRLSDPSQVTVREFIGDWLKRELRCKAEKTRSAYEWELNHTLRHTYGSILLANGVKLEVVSRWMGHANPTITLNVYRHLLEGELFENVCSTASPLEPPGEFESALPLPMPQPRAS